MIGVSRRQPTYINTSAIYKLDVDSAAYGGQSVNPSNQRLLEDTFIVLCCRALVKKMNRPVCMCIGLLSELERWALLVSVVDRVIHTSRLAREIKKQNDINDATSHTTIARFVTCRLKFPNTSTTCSELSLSKRIHNKETHIRIQAAAALSKLCGPMDSSIDSDGQTAIDAILDTLTHNPVAYTPPLTIPVSLT
ncbi:hypothetical protein JVT61DRAFT_15063 [Boletus reticuloceps]|uniref:Uncharacterized protein n=1 Tax=Boletus reticuloceps TaxID=495285 RepID=A0A8I2YUL2_9AGAM|nr:hypothetical protein JVT61DRAFT_15063 [Boletus reticuloceps]